MHQVVQAFAAVTLGLAASSIAAAAGDDRGVLHDTGSAISSGAKATGQAVEHGAQATGNAVTSGVEKAGEAVKSGAGATTDMLGLTDRDRAYYDAHQRGRQQLTGTVAMVDHDAGRLSVDGAGATYQLQFPPQALAEVRTGDRLIIATGFARPEGEHSAAATQQGTARTLERDDRIAVRLAFQEAPAPSSRSR